MKNFEGCIFMMQQEENKKESNEFIVEVSDCGGSYISSLLNIINKRHSDGVDYKAAKAIEYGDYLVFTKTNIYIKDGNKYNPSKCNKILDLIDDYYEIENLIKKLYKKSSDYLSHNDCKKCPYYKASKRQMKSVLFDGDFVDFDEKVSIFNNFVKIGYDQYDIKDKGGKSFVNIGDSIYEVISNDIFFKPKKESICSKLKKKCIKICS